MQKFFIWAVIFLGVGLLGPGKVQAGILPSPSGPYAVGAQVRYWTDPSRREDFNQKQDEPGASPRRLIVHMWYPAAKPDREKKFPKADYHLHSRELVEDAHQTFGLPAFMIKRLAFAKTSSYLGIPMAAGPSPYPVIIFAHGVNGTSVQNTFQFQELASHGFIVVSPEHAGAAIGTVFPDGSHTGTVDGSRVMRGDEEFINQMLDVWRQDTRFVLDQLEQLNKNDPEHLLDGRMDLSRIGIFGHSLGGASAAYSLMEDERIKAAINIDGFLPGKGYQMTSSKPFLEVRSRVNCKTDFFGQLVLVKEEGNHRTLSFMKANHFSFTDLPLSFLARPLTAPYIRKIHKDLNAATVDFFTKYLGEKKTLP